MIEYGVQYFSAKRGRTVEVSLHTDDLERAQQAIEDYAAMGLQFDLVQRDSSPREWEKVAA